MNRAVQTNAKVGLESSPLSPQGTRIGDHSHGALKRGAITGELNTNSNLLRRRCTALQHYFCVNNGSAVFLAPRGDQDV
jgi:hypothetical protein